MLNKSCTSLWLRSYSTSPPGQGRTLPLLCEHCCKVYITDCWKAIKHILRYIAGTINFGLMFTSGRSADCTGFSDADWVGDNDDHKSTSGYLFQVKCASASWKSMKQLCVALSTAEADYMSLTLAAQEVIWLNHLLAELQMQKEHPNQPSYMEKKNNQQFVWRKIHSSMVEVNILLSSRQNKEGNHRCAMLMIW